MSIWTFERYNFGTLEHWNFGTLEYLNIQHSISIKQHLVISIALVLFKPLIRVTIVNKHLLHQWLSENLEKLPWYIIAQCKKSKWLVWFCWDEFWNGCYHVFLKFSFWYRNKNVLDKSWGVVGRGLGWRLLGSIPTMSNFIPTQSQQEV